MYVREVKYIIHVHFIGVLFDYILQRTVQDK
jgi:hypothetical protein